MSGNLIVDILNAQIDALSNMQTAGEMLRQLKREIGAEFHVAQERGYVDIRDALGLALAAVSEVHTDVEQCLPALETAGNTALKAMHSAGIQQGDHLVDEFATSLRGVNETTGAVLTSLRGIAGPVETALAGRRSAEFVRTSLGVALITLESSKSAAEAALGRVATELGAA